MRAASSTTKGKKIANGVNRTTLKVGQFISQFIDNHMWQFLSGKKTYLLALATVIYAGLGMLTGNMDGNTGMQLIITALGAAFVRHGISSTQ